MKRERENIIIITNTPVYIKQYDGIEAKLVIHTNKHKRIKLNLQEIEQF